MIGGKIIDYYTVKKYTMFLVKSEFDEVSVRAEIPDIIIKEIQLKDSIWWQGEYIYLKVFDISDVPFKKISTSSGDAKTFYNHKKKELNQVK